tara:strand:+ start:128 stop:397 length:270 start_codon:yes stop_codon:yes gene_type:complete
MQPDINKYLPMLENMDLSREKKIELIHDLWNIMESFVDRAYGIHPDQQTAKKNRVSDLQDSAKSIKSNNHQNTPLLPPPAEGVRNHDTT